MVYLNKVPIEIMDQVHHSAFQTVVVSLLVHQVCWGTVDSNLLYWTNTVFIFILQCLSLFPIILTHRKKAKPLIKMEHEVSIFTWVILVNSAFFCLGLRAGCKSKEDGKPCACKQLERSVKLIVWKNPKPFFFLVCVENKTRKNHFTSMGRIYWLIKMINFS